MNGVFPTIQYYLRLISLKKFMNDYSELINLDQELNLIHKEKWNQIYRKIKKEILIFILRSFKKTVSIKRYND